MHVTTPRRVSAIAALLTMAVVVAGSTAYAGQRDSAHGHRDAATSGPLIFGHRGASGYRPEHTLASYNLAIRMGADAIEPDLVSTKDGVLVARHENEIGGTTDVADQPEFADRKTTKTIDGVATTGWFTEDFTLAEFQTLRAKERLPDVRQENTIYNGRYQVPTFQQVIDLAERASSQYGRTIGIAPETKHPTYFDSIGLSLAEKVVQTLRRNGLDRRGSEVYLQSFEEANLRELRTRFHLKVNLVQLTSASGRPYDHVGRPEGDLHLGRRARPGQGAYLPARRGRQHRGTHDAGDRRARRRSPGGALHVPGGERLPAAAVPPRHQPDGLR